MEGIEGEIIGVIVALPAAVISINAPCAGPALVERVAGDSQIPLIRRGNICGSRKISRVARKSGETTSDSGHRT